MTIRSLFLAILTGMVGLLVPGCNGPVSPNEPVQVKFTSPASGPSIDQGQSVNFQVSIVGDPSNQGVSWSLQVAHGTPVGFLNNETSTAASYTAPPSVTTQTQVSVVATSVADPSSTAAIAVIVEPPPVLNPSSSPITGPCPPAGTVITSTGQAPYQHVWTAGTALTYDLGSQSSSPISGGVSPYTWSITSGSFPAGLSLELDDVTNVMSLTGTPASAGCSMAMVQVTDSAGVSSTPVPYYVLVLPPHLAPQLPPLPTAYVGVAYAPSALKASGGTPPYTWTQDTNPSASFPPGLSASSPSSNPNVAVISGTPTSAGLSELNNSPAMYVYDSQLPYPATAHPGPTLGAGQVLNPDTSCHTGSEGSLSSQAPYAFLLRGFDAHGPVIVAGNFTADGSGNVVAGVLDINSMSGSQPGLNVLAGSTYTLGLINRGCLTLASSAGTTLTFRTAFGGCSSASNGGTGGGCQNTGHFTRGSILLDDPATGIRATGIIRLQDPTTFTNSGLSGLYAFGFSGWDSSGGRYAVAGSASASSGAFSSVAADTNDAGTLGTNLVGGSGNYTVTSTGRGTASISVGSATYGMAVYPVSSTEAIFAGTDSIDSTHPMIGGEAIGAVSSFSASALQNSYMLEMGGLSSGSADANLGLLTFDGVSAVTGTIYENNAGTLGTTSISATYTIDAGSGRLVLSAGQQNQNLGAHPVVAYVATPANGISGFVVSTDASAQAGMIEFQAQNPPLTNFGNASLQGAGFIGTSEPLASGTWNYAGTGVFNGNGGFGGLGVVLDASYPLVQGAIPAPTGLVPNDQFAYSYTVGKNGVGTFGGQTVSVTNGSTIFSLDESPLDLSPAIVVMEQ